MDHAHTMNKFNNDLLTIKEELLKHPGNTIYGYDNSKKVFLVENQWGTSWGNAGLYYISYSMFTSSNSKIMEAYSVQ